MWRLVCVVWFFAACDARMLPPLGEAVLVVDTDAPVPKLVSRFRLDVYSADGRSWKDSRDIARMDRADWPVSFGLYSRDEVNAVTVLVRLRAYPAGHTRPYDGERFTPRPDPEPLGEILSDPAGDGEPHLLDGRTPTSEPEPAVTIDRLLLVRIEPHVRGRVRVVMRGACSGTMADLGSLRTCIDTENTLGTVGIAPMEPTTEFSVTSVHGSFGADLPCKAGTETRAATTASDGTPLFDEEVCVPGGSFLFGNRDQFARGGDFPNQTSGVPERVALVNPFRMDRYEVTVGRWREAVARGFVPAEIVSSWFLRSSCKRRK